VLLISTLLNAAYFAPVVYQGFFGKTSAADAHHNYSEAHPAMVIPLSITAVLSVLIGLYPAFFMRFVQHLIT
jgi:multicomponent Na+:H+ antiporter subunit D